MTRLTVRLTPEQLAFLEGNTKPFQHKSDVVRDLIDSARLGVDRPLTLAERPAEEGSGASTSSSIPRSIHKKKNKKEGRKETIYPEAFTQFWKAYQQLPEKASKQSKPLALQAWTQATEFNDPAQLLRAVEKQLQIQQDQIAARGFTVAMPDCFRWLRDECFVALLEDHAPAHREGDWI